MTRNFRYLLVTLAVALGMVCAVGVYVAINFQRISEAIHQKNLIRELAAWEEEYGSVTTREEALRAAEMLDYARRYYVIADYYQSDPERAAALKSQRQKTIEAIVAGLQKYTGEDFGNDSGKCGAYLHRQPADKP